MAISTNGTVIARLAGGLYNQTLSNATYNEVVAVVKSAADINTLANDLYARDFASKTDLSVAKTIVANLGLSSITGLDNWVSAQLTAAGSAKGAKVVSLLNDLSNLTSDATYGSYAAAFNAKTDAALALSQKVGSAGGDFNAAATLAAADAAAAAAKAAADAAAKAAADAAAKAAADAAAAAAKAAADAAAAKVVADAAAAAAQPKTFTLTTGVNSGTSFTGGTGSDSFDGSLGGSGANLQTLGSADSLDGGLGSDVLIATLTGSTTSPTLAGIESITATATGTATLSMLNAAGYTSLENANSTAALSFTNISSTSVALKDTNNSSGTTFGYTTAAVAGTADSATLTLTNVSGGTETINGVETINLVSNGAANSITLSADAATTVGVTGDQNLTLGSVGSTVTNVNASAFTGKLSVTTTNATAATVTGGTANDTITGGAGNDNISGGDGADSLTGGAGNDVLSGGKGADTIVGGSENDNISGGDDADTLVFTTLSAMAGNGTVSGGAGTDTMRFTGDIGADVVESTLVNTRVSTVEAIDLRGVNAAARSITLTDAALAAQGTTTFTVTDGTYTDAATNNITVNASALTAANSVDATFNNRAFVEIRVTTAANATNTVAIAVGGTTIATYTAGAANDANAAATAAGIAAAINATSGYVATVLNTDYVAISTASPGTALAAVTATTTGAARIDGQGAAGSVTADVVLANNSYTGGAGADTFRVGNVGGGITSNDTLAGGTGTDTLIVTGGTSTATTVDMTRVSSIETINTSGTGLVTINAFANTSIAAGATLTVNASSQTVASRGLNLDASNNTTTGKLNVTSGAGADTIVGSAGSDSIDSGSGNDTITAGSGNDSLTGGDGDDSFVYASEAAYSDDTGLTLVYDTVAGGAGNDIVQFTTSAPSLSAAQLAGLSGIEIIDLAVTASSITLSDAVVDANGGDVQQIRVTDAATVTASALTAPNAVAVRVENAVGSGVVSVTGGAGADSVTFSGATNGVLAASDAVKLGAGTDTIYVTNVAGHAAGTGSSSSATLSSLVTGVENLVISDLATDQSAGDVSITLDSSFTATTFTVDASQLDAGEDLTFANSANTTATGTGAAAAVSVTGGAGADGITGGVQADTLVGGAGDDNLTGGAGIDNLSGGEGNDTFTVATLAHFAGLLQAETVSGGAGNDTLTVSDSGTINAPDLLGLNSVETITFTNTAAINTIFLSDAAYTANGLTTLAVTDTGTGNFGITVNAAGLSAVNSVQISTANATGDDILTGGSGNDTFTVIVDTTNTLGDIDANDSIIGGAGNDTLTISTVSAAATVASFANVSGIETINASVGTNGALTNAITLPSIPDTLVAAGATLTMNFATRTGAVIMNATNSEADGKFNITTGTGADTITGGAGADTADGGSGSDSITGGAGADSLIGNAGDDTIAGGTGADTLTGGSGSDVFQFTAVDQSSGATVDTITDFSTTDDQLQVTLNYGSLGAAVTVNAVRVTAGAGVTEAQASLSGERGQYVYDTTASKLYVNVNNDNLLTSLDYAINVNAASTATATVANTDINFVVTGTTLGDVITTDGGNDTITSNGGADTISSGAGVDSITATAGGTIDSGSGADAVTLNGAGDYIIKFTSSSGSDVITNTSGWATGGNDKIQLSMAAFAIGNSDTTADNAETQANAAAVSANAELAVIQTNAGTAFTAADTSSQAATKAAAVTNLAFGGAVAAGVTKILAFDDGTNTAVFKFVSAANDTSILAAELTLVGIFMGVAATAHGDYVFIA